MSNTSTADGKQRGGSHVVVVGGANIDTTGVAGSRIVAGESTPGAIVTSFGGVGRNIAESLSRLDIRTSFAGAIGNDADGLAMLEHLREAGVDAHCFRSAKEISSPDQRTPAFISVVATSGHDIAQIADMKLLEETSAQQIEHLAPLFKSATTLVIDANLPTPVLTAIFAMNINVPVIADAVSPHKCQRLSRWLKSISLLKVNEAEAATLTATAPSTKGYSDRLIERLKQTGPERILLSRGVHGAVLLDGNDRFDIAGSQNEAVNFNGCGDALLAGVIAADLRGYPTPIQLRWGQQLATRASEVHSAVNPEIGAAELESLLHA